MGWRDYMDDGNQFKPYAVPKTQPNEAGWRAYMPKPEYQSAPDKYRQNEMPQQPNQDATFLGGLAQSLKTTGGNAASSGEWLSKDSDQRKFTDALETLQRVKSGDGSLWDSVKGFSLGARYGGGNNDDAIAYLSKQVGKAQQAKDSQAAEIDARTAALSQATPNYDNKLGNWAYGGLQSFVGQAPAMGLSLLTRSPTPMLGSAGITTGLPKTVEARRAGYSPSEAAGIGLLHGGIEVATELAPAGALVKGAFGQSPIGKSLKKEFVSDLIGENIAAITQGAADTKAGLGGAEKGNWRQYLQSLPDAMGQATVGSLVGSSVTGLPMYATNRLINGKPQPKSFTKADLQPQTPSMQVPQSNKYAPLVGAIRKAGAVGGNVAPTTRLTQIDTASRKRLKYNDNALNEFASHTEQKYGLPSGILNAIKNHGERSNSWQVSSANARGVMQFIGSTAKQYGLNDPNDPVQSIDAAGRYFKDMLKRYNGNIDAAITEYNGGIKQAMRVKNGGQPTATETINYLKRVKSGLGGSVHGVDGGYQAQQDGGLEQQAFDAQTQQFDAESALQDYQDELQSQLEDMQAAQEQAYADQQDAYDERMSELQDKLDALQGADTEVEVNGKYEPSQWMIQEADSLGATMDKADNQLRDRTRLASDMQINEMANNLDYRKLMDSPMMDYGAPTLTNDGKKVIGGNGRVAAIKRAYESGKADTYREHIKSNAGRFGFTPEQVAQYKKPVLTRRFKNFVDTQKAAIASNEGGGLSMSALEQTKVDASRLPPLSAFSVNDTGELNTAANRDAIRAFVGAFPTNQQAALIGSDGQLSQSGVARLRNAILHKAYGDSDTLGRMVESTDQGSRNIVNALTQSAPNVADVKDGIAKGELHDADITDDMLQAVEILNQIKADGGTIRAYLSQLNILDEHITPAARKLLRFFGDNLNSAKKIRELIGAYNDTLRAQGNPNQGDVFGDKVTVDKNQLLDKVLKDHGQQQSELDNSGRTENGQSARYEKPIGAPDNETQGRPDSGRGDAQSNRTSGAQGQSERGRIDRGQPKDLTLTGQTEAEIAHTEAQIKLAEKQRELAEKKLEAERAQDELHKTVQQRNESANDNFTLGQSADDNVSGQDAMFSRAPDTQKPFNGQEVATTPIGELTEIDVDGIKRSTLNSNGKPIHWSQEGVRNFWRWFGDSKVVDEQGNPLVVYHGTTADFNTFDINKFGKTDKGFAGKGFYFTNNAEISSTYATDSVWIPKNKLVDGGNVNAVYLNLRNPYVTDVYDISDEPKKGYKTTSELRDSQHDGVIVTDTSGTNEYVVYESNQIKSSTGNSGDFSHGNNDIRFSRTPDTKAKYEARIDELFNGGKANLHGVTVLDKSDVLDMLGYGGKPVNLAESKVVMGMSNHPLMTADVWKKIPEWIENPAAVFESDTETNRLVFIAPELVRNKPVRIILIPDGSQLKAHVLLNAYDAHVSMPWKRWVSDGLMKYVDMKKAQSVLDGSNLNVALPSNRQNLSSQYPKSFQSQLTGMLSKYQGRARILTEKNLSGYRKSQQSVHPSNDVGQKTTGNTASAVRQNIAKMFGVTDLSGLSNLSVMQSATPEVLAKIENGTFSQIGNESIQGAYDPKTGKIFMFADAIPQGQERGVFLHEVFHKRGRELMGEHYSRLKSFVDGWANAKVGTVEHEIYTAAKARADASGETGTRYDDELIAYAIEESVNRGIEPQAGDLGKTTAQGFMARVRQLFTNVMKKMHPNFNGKFTAEDMVTIAHAAAGLEFDSSMRNTANSEHEINIETVKGFENVPDESIAHEEKVYKEGKIFNQAGEWKLGKSAYDKLTDVAKSNYSPLSWLKFVSNKPAVFTSIMHDYRAENTKFQRAAQDIANESKSFDAIERKVLKELLTNELEFDTVPPEHIVQVANEIRTLLNNQTDELVANGMLSRESAERWRESYLPRFYDKQADLFGGVKQGLNFIKSARAAMRMGMDGSHLKGRGIFKSVPKGSEAQYEAQGWEVRGQDAKGNPVVWRDYTKAERANMNENQDGIMSFTAGYMQTQADLAKARLFKRVAENDELASKTYRQDWVQVPDIPIADTGIRKFGALGGMFVHPEVYDHMKNEFGFANQGALLKTWRKALGYWKATKTVYNPVAHMNNMVSNVSMLWLAGGNPQDLVIGCRDLIKQQGYYDEAIDAGLIGDGVDSAAIRDMFGGVQNVKEHGAVMNYLAEKSANWHVLKPLTALKEAAEKAYRTEDEVFKFSLYTQQRNKGMSIENAREYANQFFFDYTDMPQGLRVLRDTGVLPFISYTSKAIPAIMRASLTRPHRMLAWVGAAHAINALSYMVLGAAGDEDEEKKNMPEYRQGAGLWGMPRQIRLPWNDDGKAAFIDITRMIPLGDFTDTTNQQGGLPLPNWMMPSGPVLGAISVFVMNKDPFTGDEFKKSYETVGDAKGKYAKWLLQQWLPSSVVVPFSYHTNNVLDGVKSQFENTWASDALEAIGYTGRKRSGDVVKLDDALRGSIGIKTWGFDPKQQAAKDMRRKQFEAREIKSDMSRTRKDSSLTAAQKADKLNAQRQSLERLFTTE